jgi:hypothetical protein
VRIDNFAIDLEDLKSAPGDDKTTTAETPLKQITIGWVFENSAS